MPEFYEKLCACGCGQKIPIRKYHSYKGRKIPDYLSGHDRTGCKLSEEHKKVFSRKGRTNSDDHRRKSGLARRGRTIEQLGHPSGCRCCICVAKRGEQHIGLMSRKKRSEALRGEKSHFWRGGISFLPYPPEFNSDLKKQIFLRDEGACQICKLHKGQGSKKSSYSSYRL